jgi:hypothetical protein
MLYHFILIQIFHLRKSSHKFVSDKCLWMLAFLKIEIFLVLCIWELRFPFSIFEISEFPLFLKLKMVYKCFNPFIPHLHKVQLWLMFHPASLFQDTPFYFMYLCFLSPQMNHIFELALKSTFQSVHSCCTWATTVTNQILAA